ncbi:MAG: hypothetical protein QGH45_22190, partial [Myxococcota bacterium]|nr:hypothetical protein [Myxococcota bacterium]
MYYLLPRRGRIEEGVSSAIIAACGAFYPALGNRVPGVCIRMLYTDVRAVKNMVRLSAEPQSQLAVYSGSVIVPRWLPDESNTQQPPG